MIVPHIELMLADIGKTSFPPILDIEGQIEVVENGLIPVELRHSSLVARNRSSCRIPAAIFPFIPKTAQPFISVGDGPGTTCMAPLSMVAAEKSGNRFGTIPALKKAAAKIPSRIPVVPEFDLDSGPLKWITLRVKR